MDEHTRYIEIEQIETTKENWPSMIYLTKCLIYVFFIPT